MGPDRTATRSGGDQPPAGLVRFYPNCLTAFNASALSTSDE